MKSEDFIYASTRVRVLEKNALHRSQVERMLNASNFEESYKILADLGLDVHGGKEGSTQEFQEVLNKELRQVQVTMEELCKEKSILDLLFLPYDFHNIKTMVKGFKSGKGREEILQQTVAMGRIPVHALEDFITKRDPGSLKLNRDKAAFLEKTLLEAETLFEENEKDPRFLDMIIDKGLFILSLSIAEKSKNDFLMSWIKKTIDLMNLKTILRIKFLNQDAYFKENNRLEKVLIEGGNITKKVLLELFTMSLETLPFHLGEEVLQKWIERAIEEFLKEGSFMELEKGAEEIIATIFKKGKTVTFGPEVLVNYWMTKQRDAKVLRMILIGKKNNLAQNKIKKHVPSIYL